MNLLGAEDFGRRHTRAGQTKMIVQRFLLLWLTGLSALAFYWPRLIPGDFDPFLATDRYELLKPLFRITMFSIGALLPRDEIEQVIRRWPSVLGGTAIQYTVMPLLAWSIGHAFGLPQEALIGVVLVGCVPGAMASNVLTLAAGGNVSYSVSLTTSATLLSPLVVPFTLMLTLGAEVQLDPWKTFFNLTTLVVAPVVMGYVISLVSDPAAHVLRLCGPIAANVTILWIVAVVVGINRDNLSAATPLILSALLLVNVAGYFAGDLGSLLLRLPDPMRRALTLEVGMQNAGLGAVLARDLFPDSPEVAIPTAAYTFGCMLTGTILAYYWARKS